MLNAFVGRRIARTSTTPGKTRALNVFEVRVGTGEAGDRPRTPRSVTLYLLDLPGYGYARASQAERTAFRGLVRHVLTRPRLAGVVWLLDIRRELSPEDQAMQDAFAAAGTRVLAAITKGDKVPRAQQVGRVAALGETLGVDADQVILTSARTGLGVPELRAAIRALARSA